MQTVIGVTFRSATKLYYFDPVDNKGIKVGDMVVVETTRGMEVGRVIVAYKEIEPDPQILPIKPIVKVMDEKDLLKIKENKQRERDAHKICAKKVKEHELDMKLIDAQYTFDNTKVIFYFVSDGRIDFRALVKDLAAIFKMRIELRQIGVRDAAKMKGGLGTCGRVMCCSSYMHEFTPVSIKMAKTQNLSLNPNKISGSCGRLMCCLNNENETYIALNKNLPNPGDVVKTMDNLNAVVQSVNVLRQSVKIIVDVEKDEKEIRTVEIKDIKFKPSKRKHMELSKEELKELKELEALED